MLMPVTAPVAIKFSQQFLSYYYQYQGRAIVIKGETETITIVAGSSGGN